MPLNIDRGISPLLFLIKNKAAQWAANRPSKKTAKKKRRFRKRGIIDIYIDKYAERDLLVTSNVEKTHDFADFICLECGHGFREMFNCVTGCAECKKTPAIERGSFAYFSGSSRNR